MDNKKILLDEAVVLLIKHSGDQCAEGACLVIGNGYTITYECDELTLYNKDELEVCSLECLDECYAAFLEPMIKELTLIKGDE